jgi:hypothetical protein
VGIAGIAILAAPGVILAGARRVWIITVAGITVAILAISWRGRHFVAGRTRTLRVAVHRLAGVVGGTVAIASVGRRRWAVIAVGRRAIVVVPASMGERIAHGGR